MDTTPVAVTIFSDRARVTRQGRQTLAVGAQKLEVTNLPLSLLPESVRATGRGTARAKLLGVTTRLENFSETPAERTRALEQQIQALEDADAEAQARLEVLHNEQKHLDTLAAQSEMFARGLALRNRSPEEQGLIFTFISDRSRTLHMESLTIKREQRERAKELDRLRRELNAVRSARPKQRYVASVELEVLAEGDFTLELTYVVTGAAWLPLYDIRLNGSQLDVTYLAQIAQNTGEDWPSVALTLSTARPSTSLVVPELPPWFIRPRPPVVYPQPASRAKGGGLMSLAMPAPAAAPAGFQALDEAMPAREEAEMVTQSATVSEAGAALTYTLSGRSDIPGNQEPRKVTVGNFSLHPDFTYVTAPKLEPVCYRRAEVRNTSEYTFLPGNAQLFEGDEYLGATALPQVAPNQKFELALGTDERMRVERKLVASDVDKAFALMGDRQRRKYGFTIEVENLRDTAQVVFVRDQLPKTQDDQIKVKLESADPKPTEQSELNLLEWKLLLDKGAKKTIRFDYSVEHPKGMDIIGLKTD